MSRAALVVMAAGLGSRFGGGIKQLEPIGPNGESIMEYSIYNALEAGFDKVVFVIRRDLESSFRDAVGKRIEQITDVAYVFQEVEDIPDQYRERFAGRTKPWGTGQAILCCRNAVSSPFLVINADDYYGKQAYIEAFQYLTQNSNGSGSEICMVGFVLKNTLSDNGAVTRGLCQAGPDGMLRKIVETRNIEKLEGGAVVRSESGDQRIDADSLVSMNMWGLQPEFFSVLESGFAEFLEGLEIGEGKAEYLLPTIIGGLLEEGRATVKVLQSTDKWFGVTYKEDKEGVAASVRRLVDKGIYPEKLFPASDRR